MAMTVRPTTMPLCTGRLRGHTPPCLLGEPMVTILCTGRPTGMPLFVGDTHGDDHIIMLLGNPMVKPMLAGHHGDNRVLFYLVPHTSFMIWAWDERL